MKGNRQFMEQLIFYTSTIYFFLRKIINRYFFSCKDFRIAMNGLRKGKKGWQCDCESSVECGEKVAFIFYT